MTIRDEKGLAGKKNYSVLFLVSSNYYGEDMDSQTMKSIMECLLFASPEPLNIDKISQLIFEGSENVRIAHRELRRLMQELINEYNEKRGLQIIEIAGGYQMCTRSECASWVKKLSRSRGLALSRASLETLAIIAYRQPVARADIEAVRGVDCEASLHTLLDRNLVCIRGRKRTIGRPFLYGTTREFLRYFGLKNLSDLPKIEELKEGIPEKGCVY